MAKEPTRGPDSWTYLTNHTHVLVCLSRDPDARVRDIAAQVGITERAVQSILGDLESSGVLLRTRDGRRNHYEIRGDVPLRHPLEAQTDVGGILEAVLGSARRQRERRRAGGKRERPRAAGKRDSSSIGDNRHRSPKQGSNTTSRPARSRKSGR